MSFEDDFEPLKTRSGLPHLSNEQRALWRSEKTKNMAAISPILNNDAYKKLFGIYDDFQIWRVTDLIYPQIHPIHCLHLSIMKRLDDLVEKEGQLQAMKEMGQIEDEEYKQQRGLLNFYYIQVCSNLDLKVKKTYNEMMRQIKNDSLDYSNVEPAEKSCHPAIQVS